MEALAADPMAPDEVALRADLASARFQEGVDRGRWRLIELDWPIAVIAISAAPRDNGPAEFFFRFELQGYPNGPTACPWDVLTKEPLAPEKRPKGERVAQAFRTDWEGGRALYVPWDRKALVGHDGWLTRHRRELWRPAEGIACYLRHTHDLLSDEEYEGV